MVDGITIDRNVSQPESRYTWPISRSRRSTLPTPSMTLAATTGSVIMNVVKMGAMFVSPNQMSETTIHTKTEVELRTVTTSATAIRAGRHRNEARPMSTATTSALPKPIAMRKSEAPACVHTSPRQDDLDQAQDHRPRATA